MILDPFPDVIRIEPAGICNLHCRHCPVGREGGKRGLLPFDTFKTIYNSLPPTPRVLVLYHGGEPLLNDDLLDMAFYAKDKGVCKIVLNTNGSKLIPGMDYSAIDEMRISLDGNSAAENDRIRVGSNFIRIGYQVRALSRYENRPKQITIYNINTQGKVAEYLLDFFKGYDVVFRSDKMREWARVDNEPKITNGITYCPSLFETFTILSDGHVVMCCEDLMGDELQGSVITESPLDIWNNMQPIRDAFRDGYYPELCKRCYRVKGI